MTQNQLKWLELNEMQRSNIAREQETQRANLAKEGLTTRQLVETERTQRLHDEGFSPTVARAQQAADATNKFSQTVKNWFSLMGGK